MSWTITWAGVNVGWPPASRTLAHQTSNTTLASKLIKKIKNQPTIIKNNFNFFKSNYFRLYFVTNHIKELYVS